MVQTFSTETSVPLPYHVLAPAYFLRYPNPYAQHVLSADVIEQSIVHRPARASGGDPQPILFTARVLLKKGTLPSWAPKGLMKNAESYVLEVSEVDLEAGPVNAVASSTNGMNEDSPFAGMFHRGWGSETRHSSTSVGDDVPQGSRGRQMRTWTRNLDHTTVLAVAEGLTFTELLERVDANDTASSSSTIKGKGKAAVPPALPNQLHCLTSAHITSDVSVLWHRIEKFGLKRFKAHMDTSRQGLLWSAAGVSNQRYPHNVSPPVQTPITRLRESLRPPWLDGLPLGPIQSIRQKGRSVRERLEERYRLARDEGIWIGGRGRKDREMNMEQWREAFRERLVKLRGRVIGGGLVGRDEVEVDDDPRKQHELAKGDFYQSSLEMPRERVARLAEEARVHSQQQPQSSRSWWGWLWSASSPSPSIRREDQQTT